MCKKGASDSGFYLFILCFEVTLTLTDIIKGFTVWCLVVKYLMVLSNSSSNQFLYCETFGLCQHNVTLFI